MSSHNNSVRLLEVIVRLQPELSQLTNADYPQFLEELNHLLQEINEHLSDMLDRYSIISERVQEAYNSLEGEAFTLSHGLYGDPITIRPDVVYICSIGPHNVQGYDVMQRDVMGRPICPEHGKAMNISR